jgi:hypothetical protein
MRGGSPYMLMWLWGLISRTPPRPASSPGKLAVEKPDRHDPHHACGASPAQRTEWQKALYRKMQFGKTQKRRRAKTKNGLAPTARKSGDVLGCGGTPQVLPHRRLGPRPECCCTGRASTGSLARSPVFARLARKTACVQAESGPRPVAWPWARTRPTSKATRKF